MTTTQHTLERTDEHHPTEAVTLLPVDLIDRAEDNPRTPVEIKALRGHLATYRKHPEQTPDAWQPLCELALSIEAQGVLQPVTVTPNKGRYLLVMGERRWAAATAVGVREIRAIVKTQSDAQRREAMIVENLHRQDLTPLEEARAFANLKELGRSQRQIAKLTGVSQAHISKRIALLRLPKKVQRLLANQELTIREAEALAQLAAHRDRMNGLLAVIMSHKPAGLHEATLTSRLKGELDAIAQEKERATRRKAAQAQAAAEKLRLLEWPQDVRDWFEPRDERPLVGQEHGRCVHHEAVLIDANEATRTAHREQPCHAAVICPHGELVVLCTAPTDHEPQAKPDPKPTPQAEPAQQPKPTPDEASDHADKATPPDDTDDRSVADSGSGDAAQTETDEDRAARERAEAEARRLRDEAEAAARREAKEREEAEAAHQAHQQALTDAQGARREHIKKLVDQQGASLENLIGLIGFMVDQWLTTSSESFRKDVCELLDIEVEPGHFNRTDHAEALSRWINEDPGNRAHRAGRAATLLLAEWQLADQHSHWTAPEIIRHFAYLTAHSYQPTAAEQAELEGRPPGITT